MPWQKPKANHPWRRYKDKKIVLEKENKGIKPVRLFLTEIVESWNRVEIITSAYGKEDRFKLTDLPQRKVAAWLAGILRRNYG